MELPFRTVLIDDEPDATQLLEKHLADFPEVQVIGKTHYAMEAVEMVQQLEPALLFLDIELPGKSGFDILDELLNLGLKPQVIFVTAYNDYAIRAIRYAAFDYLLKPVDQEELKAVISRLGQSTAVPNRGEQIRVLKEQMTATKVLKFSTTGGFVVIKPEDIIYITADWNYAEIHFDDEKKEIVTMNLGSLEDILPPALFFRISRSVIINIGYLTRVSRKKRIATLVKDGKEFSFVIPLLNIRRLEKFLESD